MGNIDDVVMSNQGADIGHNDTVNNVAHQYFMTVTMGEFLIQGLHISSVAGITVAMVFVMVLSALWQTIQYLYNQLQKPVLTSRNDRHSAVLHNRTHFKITCLRMTTVLLGHVMMVCVMSMNIWLLVSVVMGAGLAYLFMLSRIDTWMFEKRNDTATHADHSVNSKKAPTNLYIDSIRDTRSDTIREETACLNGPV